MDPHPLRTLPGAALAAALLAAALAAQTPTDPPPWWRVNDDVTVSLYWSFAGANPLQPTQAVVPPWYNPAITQMALAGPLQVLPSLAGRSDVLALAGTGSPRSAALDLTVDNDPHLDWIKIFWCQFDAFEGAGASVAAQLEQDLAKYARAGVTVQTAALGGGWTRTTLQAQLIPQPDDEGVDWSFLTTALGSAGIDDLFVNSKCIKPGADETGDALGNVDGAVLDATALAGGAPCLAAAVTEGPGPQFARTFWISALANTAAASHTLVRADGQGTVLGTIALGDTLAQAPLGATDLAVETVVLTSGQRQQFVYALVDRRASALGAVALRCFDATTGAPVPARSVLIANFPPVAAQRFGLAFEPSGDLGQGAFWITDPNGNGWQFGRSGALLRSVTGLPPGTVGAGYDAALGNFYFLSRQPRATPSGPVQCNGFEWSGYDLQATGVEFCGDLRQPNPGGPRGGLAGGLECYRRQNGDLRPVCIADAGGRSLLYELAGPFRFGWSLLGRCGMAGGPPFLGSQTFALTLQGVPNASFAALQLGFSNQSYLGAPLPRSLQAFGLAESTLSVSLDLGGALVPPFGPGAFRVPLPLPPAGSGLAYVPIFAQWVVFDPTAPGGIALSTAGKTVLY